MANNSIPRIGISSCLTGLNVRYDGGNTHHQAINDLFSEFELITYCPEVEMGLGIPRETIQLVLWQDKKLLMPSSRVRDLNKQAIEAFQSHQFSNLSGYILQSRSPSCGLGTSKLYKREGEEECLQSERENGLFTDYLISLFPNLPMIDSSDLDHENLVEQFLQKVMAYHKNKKAE